ncbi:hypothetical protein BJX96DRAFT_158655 [Aspergillus floccosus]
MGTMSEPTHSHRGPLSLIRSHSSKSQHQEDRKPSSSEQPMEPKSPRVKPHRFRILNRLDPRFNQDLLDAKARGEIGDI